MGAQMATAAETAYAVNTIYGSKGQQPNEAILAAWAETLVDRSDYQVRRALREALKLPGAFAVDAGTFREMAGRYAKTYDDEVAAREREAQRLRIAQEQPATPTPERLNKVRQAMRDEAQRIVDENGPGAAWAAEALKRLNRDDCNPLAVDAPSAFSPDDEWQPTETSPDADTL